MAGWQAWPLGCDARSTVNSCITVISGLHSAPINRPHLLIFKRKKKLYINKPRLSISRRCPRDCGQASRHSRLCGQISRHGNSTAPIILTFTVNTSNHRCGQESSGRWGQESSGRWGQESSVRGTTSGFHSSLHSVSLSFALSMSLSSRGKSALELALSSSSRRVYTVRWSAVLRRATVRREALRYAVKRSFRRRVYFLRSPRAYRARKHTEKWAVCVITGRNRRMTGVGKCPSGVNSQAPAL